MSRGSTLKDGAAVLIQRQVQYYVNLDTKNYAAAPEQCRQHLFHPLHKVAINYCLVGIHTSQHETSVLYFATEADIYAIKRQYLGLLPPQQIIDICLTFEAHAPLHVKSSVWPYDIRAAIASILAQKAQVSQTQTSPDLDASSRTSAPDPPSPSTAQSQTSPSQQSSTPTSAQPSASTSSISQPAASQIPPTNPGPHYPHQPYYHPTYPHTSYYTSPPGAFGYPHPYPPYSQPPALYPVNPAGHHPPLFPNTPLVHPPHPAAEPSPPFNNVDDLPSYEEMIVEALLDSGDPEGCAPKSLFDWMAMHYPLQMNFRPSASQALQKAYKRGRLEKGSNGKYRLNENWEGGNVRPQVAHHLWVFA